MSQQGIDDLDRLLSSINVQLCELAELLSNLAMWPDGPGKQQALDKLFSNQDALLSASEKIRERLSSLLA